MQNPVAPQLKRDRSLQNFYLLNKPRCMTMGVGYGGVLLLQSRHTTHWFNSWDIIMHWKHGNIPWKNYNEQFAECPFKPRQAVVNISKHSLIASKGYLSEYPVLNKFFILTPP